MVEKYAKPIILVLMHAYSYAYYILVHILTAYSTMMSMDAIAYSSSARA